MLVSMTGFGDASAEFSGAHYSVEIRSLNNRYYKSVIKLPDNLVSMEMEVDALLRDSLGRGSVTYNLSMRVDSAKAAYHINTAALQSYIAQLKPVTDAHPALKLELAALLNLPGVCSEPSGSEDDVATHGPIVRKLTALALEKLQAMRAREGQRIYEDLVKHLDCIQTSLDQVTPRVSVVVDEYHKRLTQRVNLLIAKSEITVSQPDLLREVALYAEKSDVSEEITRLSVHLNAFRHACLTDEHAGRKLDFITQEMLREANTISSKSNDAAIAGHIVEIKGAIDRLKEQVQNVE